MVLGLAGGFLLRPVVMKEPGDLRGISKPGRTGASSEGLETASGKSDARSSGKRSAGSPLSRLSTGDPVEDVRELLASFEGIQSESQLNPMEIIRRLYLLTQLREGEVIDVLASLSNEADAMVDAQLRAIAGMVALTRLAELNGPEALRRIHSKDLAAMWEGEEDDAAVLVMNSWVAADPEGAKRWFEDGMKSPGQEEMKDLMESDDFRQAYYDGMAKHDPEALAREIGDGTDSDKRDVVMVALVRNANDPAELVELLDRCIGVYEARTEAIGKLGKVDPTAAAAWVEKQAVDNARDYDIQNVALVMLERDTERGIEWYMAQEFADADRAGDRLSRIVDHLAEKDREKAVRWIESRPDDAARDSAEISMAWQAKRKDIVEAMEWLGRVDDPRLKRDALEQMFRTEWDRRDGRLPDAVIKAAEKAGMGEAARNYHPD
jgi:hypothetical protein